MSKLPYIPLFLDSYIGGTQSFTTEQHGAYFLLLLEMWKSEGSLPNQPRFLATIAKVSTRRWPAIWESIRHKFSDAEPGRITQGRLLKEYQKSTTITEKRRAAGAKGGSSRALKDHEREQANAQANAQAGLKQMPPTEPQKVEEEKNSEAKASGAGAPDFDPKKFCFDTIAGAFVSAGGTDQHGRSMAGKLWNKHPEAVEAVLAELLAAQPANPASFFGDVFKRLARDAKAKGGSEEIRPFKIIERDGRKIRVDRVTGNEIGRAA